MFKGYASFKREFANSEDGKLLKIVSEYHDNSVIADLKMVFIPDYTQRLRAAKDILTERSLYSKHS